VHIYRALELAGTGKLERYAGERLAASSATHAGQVLSEVPDEERYPGLPGWGLGVVLTSSPRKNSVVLKPRQRGGHGPKMDRSATEDEEEEEEYKPRLPK
jgi:hypothetical protein